MKGLSSPDVARSLLGLGDALRGLGKLDAALAVEDRALAIWNAQGSLFAAKAENNRGEILAAMGRHADAEQAFRRALEGLERETGLDNFELSYPLNGLAELKLATGDPRAAVPLFERALVVRERTKRDLAQVAEVRFGLARALWEIGGAAGRALALARLAREAYADGRHATELAKVDAWLAARQARRPRS